MLIFLLVININNNDIIDININIIIEKAGLIKHEKKKNKSVYVKNQYTGLGYGSSHTIE